MGKILFTMRLIIVLLLFVSFQAKSQKSDIISWDVINSIENIGTDTTMAQYVSMMSKTLRAKNKYYMKDNMIVSIATYDSLNNIRTVMIEGANYAHMFITLDGLTKYKKQYFEDLQSFSENERLRSDEVSPVKFIENRKLGPFNCVVKEMLIPEKKIIIKTISTNDIKLSNKLTSPQTIPGLDSLGFIMDLNMEIEFFKFSISSSNFRIIEEVDTTIFSVSTEEIDDLDSFGEIKLMSLIMGADFPGQSQEEEIPLGDGENNDLYKKMCEDGVLSYCDKESLDLNLKPSYDLAYLIGIIKTNDSETYKSISKKALDKILLTYELLSNEELSSFNKIVKNLDDKIEGRTYIELIRYLKSKKMLEFKENREILITNLSKNNFKTKNESHPEATEFINGTIGWKSFLSSYKGIYDLKFKRTLNNEAEFLNEIKSFINTILPEFKVAIHVENKEIQVNKNEIVIDYPINTDYAIIDPKYDDEGSIIKSNSIKYDFENYSKSGLLDLLRQIGADYDLELVFDFINASSVLSHYQYDEKYKAIDLFEGELFLCIDKETSGESFMKNIPFTKINYNEERDKLSSIKAFYASNPGITYVPLYQKERLFKIINENQSALGIDTSFDINIWFKGIKNQQYDNVGSLLQSIPNFGVIVSTSLLNGLSYNKYGSTYQSIFPRLYQLFGQDFLPIDVVLTSKELDAELTFKFRDKSYTVESDIIKIEEAFLKKAIDILKENNLYKNKKVYQSFEDIRDSHTKKLFYLTKENQQILSEEFDLPLVEFVH